ncbi:uncharacterized protein ALTATR162_LOCUS107 [Alternaria atra]|uniref:Uncharacterized protein n=1 Tax=Alternaria atra TaxID=119953 RepID=A0A8J2HUU5_9PLEO|nr:uncharacterized protein ALTATR162_LOCUS107 [Alternaria atra]CAG5137437.1 unnamed protein product [Alternaria atra]
MEPNAPRISFTGGLGEFYTLPPDYQRPPDNPIPEGDEGLFAEELTDRLRWSVLDPATTAQIVELDNTGTPQWRPLLGAPNHALAEEPVTQPPRSRMLIAFDVVYGADYWLDADALDERPAPLVIENAGGQPITFAQFVSELHRYALELRETIFEIENRGNSDNARLYCSGASGPKRKDAGDPDALFMVYLDSDMFTSGQEFEQDWIRKAERFAKKAGLNS